MAGNHKEWIEHGENHPNINHLYVTCPWDRLRDSHKTKDRSKNKKVKSEAFLYLQRCQHKEEGCVNLNYHLKE